MVIRPLSGARICCSGSCQMLVATVEKPTSCTNGLYWCGYTHRDHGNTFITGLSHATRVGDLGAALGKKHFYLYLNNFSK